MLISACGALQDQRQPAVKITLSKPAIYCYGAKIEWQVMTDHKAGFAQRILPILGAFNDMIA